MKRVVIVGSGASGVHFALTALRKGHEVVLLDVGKRGPDPILPDEDFAKLKRSLPDPARYFLGEQFEAVLFPKSGEEYYGIPPNKNFIFDQPPQAQHQAKGFAPLFSFAQGGLAEAWTAGAYPFNPEELALFPVTYQELQPFYQEVAQRIGIHGANDDLARFFPLADSLQEPLRLDEHSALLLQRYQVKKRHLNSTLRCYLGRSRVATLSRDLGERQACAYLGRCLWGCPRQSLYTPSATLRECQRYANFRYQPDTFVTHFLCNADRQITEVIGETVRDGAPVRFPVEVLALAAGTLMSSKIFLSSYEKITGHSPRLTGLMDNRQVMVPFVNLRMIGKQANPASYQYHQLAMGLEGNSPREYVHCQITTLKTALLHPLIQNAPFDLRTSLYLFRHLHAALGLVNVNLCDYRREENYVELQRRPEDSTARLMVHYAPLAEESALLREVIGKVKRSLWALGCVVPPGMTRVRPMGASVHYAGTLPMSATASPLTTSRYGRSHDFPNLVFADGTTFPFLPAKNLTYTLMANAVRVAEHAL